MTMKVGTCGLILVASALLAGCTTTVDLTKRECLPPGIPGTVTLKRPVNLYLFEGKKTISMTDWLATSGRMDASGKMVPTTRPPLRVLPAGTNIKIFSVSRNNGFDAIETTEAHGTFPSESGPVEFRYVWGVADRIGAAPWESEVWTPTETRRLLCGDMPPGFTDP
jgi:hypothetical protein